MGTRSIISIKQSNNKYKGIYCHWDGYPSGVGKRLFENYQDSNKINELIALGDISSLQISSEETIAYHRDRGETLTKAKTFKDIEQHANNYGAEYVYIFNGEGWMCYDVYQKNYVLDFND